MANTRIRWNFGAFEQIRRAPGIRADLARRADQVAAAANASGNAQGGYQSVNSEGRTRSRAAVVTTNGAAVRDNARSNTLVRSLDAGR